jgi:hypothetical protein
MPDTTTRDSRVPGRVITFLVALLVCSCFFSFFPARAATNLMFLTVTEYEEGNSYRKLEIHNPIGMLRNPCSYADYMSATIDWNDGSGEHKPDTNAQTTLFSNKTPVIQDGMYLFWDDAHVPTGAGTHIVTTRLSLHCLGDPPGNQVYAAQNTVNVFARIPVNQVSFTKNDSAISTIKGHDVTDITITLSAPAPASGSWVHLETTPPGALNSLPAYIRISPNASQEKISNLEVKKPASRMTIIVTASSVGRPQQTQELTITP